jgi:hypothetical protein
MADNKSVYLYLSTFVINIIGYITLNNIAIMVGIVAGVTTIVYNVVKTYKEIKNK